MKGKAFCNFLFQHGRSGAETEHHPRSGAEQSDPAEGGGGGAVNRPAADPAAGRTPAKAVGRRRESGERTPKGRAVGA